MTIQAVTQNVLNANNTTGHVVTAAMLGDGLSSIAVWGLQVAHLNPPAAVDQGITAICMVVASYVMQRLAP